MKKVSIGRLSLLGLVLMGASAVTAAILPNKTAAKFEDPDNGTLTVHGVNNTNDGFTCIADNDGAYSCNVSATISTAALTNSYVANRDGEFTDQTVDNTSITNGAGTSNVQ